MGANVTVYCLEKVTDYLQFERLCHDLMALEGYPSIEPLGGFSDKGRDAVHVDRSKNTIFAYSVREDWQVKLVEDAGKVKKHGHACDELFFITTAEFSTRARDKAVEEIRDDFGWDLRLYGVERLRVLLETKYPEIRKNHPQIFPPEFLQIEANYQPIEREHIYIIYSPKDAVFSGWLAQKLLSLGYRVWCDLIKQLDADSFPDDIDDAIQNKSGVVIAVLSNSALSNMEITRQRSLALRISKEQDREHLIAIILDENLPKNNLDRDTKTLNFIDFSNGWGDGLENLLNRLKKLNIPMPLVNGMSVAARAFYEDDVILEEEEDVYLNSFDVLEVPKVIQRFKSNVDIDYKTSIYIQQVWAHRRVDNKTFLSFFTPPQELSQQYEFIPSGGGSTIDTKTLDGIYMKNLVAELLKKSLYVKCIEKGMQYCTDTNMYYFPKELIPANRLTYSRPNGSNTWVNIVGERKYWSPGKEEYYRYHLAPVFYVSQRLYANYVVMLRVRVRMTDIEGIPLPSKKALSRRKDLTNDWWNKEWVDRFFAIAHFLSEDGEIVIGTKKHEQVRISAVPTKLSSPKSINEEQMDLLKLQEIRLWAGVFNEGGEGDDDIGEDNDEQ
jgi:hypothetical protein